ncbi:TBC1 domain member 2A [Mactra antiquata]
MAEGGKGEISPDELSATNQLQGADIEIQTDEQKAEDLEIVSTPETSPVLNAKVANNAKKDHQKLDPEEKLNDWLLHTSRSRGIGKIKFTKRRYFKFIDESCKLYMYRDPQDLVPLAEINIASSSMYFVPDNHDKPGLFQIKSDGKETSLDAGSRRKMMYWLQALQAKRREFNLSRSSGTPGRVDLVSNKATNNLGGLLSKDSGSIDALNETTSVSVSDIPEIMVAEDDERNFGSNSSINSTSSSSKISLRGLNNIKTEIQQKWSAVKLPGKPSRESQLSDSIFYCDVKPRSDSEHLSISSVNSNDSCGLNVRCTLYDYDLDAGKPRTTSQISSSSAGSQEIEVTMTDGSNLDNSENWTFLDKSDSIPEEGPNSSENGDDDDSGTLKYESRSKFSGNLKNLNMAEIGKSKITSTISNLKKIKFGRRQVSEPGILSQGTPPNGRDLSKNVTMSQDQGQIQGQTSCTKDIHDLEEELQANREIISLLQQQLNTMSRELATKNQVTEGKDEDVAFKLVEKDKEICTLEHQLSKLKTENISAAENLKTTEEELNATKDQLQMYTEMLQAKDEVIVSLSHQIQQQEQPVEERSIPRTSSFEQPDVVAQSMSNRGSTDSTGIDKVNMKELERYKDLCYGYEIQHKLLVREILELNDLRKDDLTKEKKLTIDLENMRAKYCQIKSKYYVLLQEFKARGPVRGEGENQEIVNQLLNDALEPEGEDNDLHLTGSFEEYDRYGFSRKHYKDTEPVDDDDELGSKAAMLDRQSEEINANVKEADQTASLLVKWENYLARGDGKLIKGQELKTLIRQGVPHRYRAEVWKSLIQFQIGHIRDKKEPNFYQKLLQQRASGQRSDPAIKQIELDLLRTLPNNRHYETIESDGVVRLRRVLLAFSEYNREIGYCQGLNRLAAIALLFLDEEDSFWCLVAIVDYLLPAEYFSSTLMAAQADQRVLKDLVQYKLPAVHQKLETSNVDLSLFTFNWFLTVFVDNVPTEMFLRIWDTFLYEGSKVLFRFAIAFLKKSENEILKQKDGLYLNRYLRTIGEKMKNVREISWYAFHWINPFRMKFLASKRQQHLQEIKGELAELDKLRHGMKMERLQSKPKEYVSDDELDN